MFLKLFIFTCTEPVSEPATKELFSNRSTPPLPLAPSLNADCVVRFIPSYLFQYFSPSRLDKLTLLERAVLWKCWEFPLDWDCAELRHCCHVRVCACIRVWEGRREGKCACTHETCPEDSCSTQAADIHVSGCSIDVLFSGMLRTGEDQYDLTSTTHSFET